MDTINSVNSVNQAIKSAHAFAVSHQVPQGYWRGSDLSNNTMEAEHIMLLHFLDINDPSLNKKIVKRILDCQHEDGTWGIYYGSPGELSTTIECYFALKLSGVDKDLPHMKKAREFILAHGGVEKARIFTKIWLALFGQWPWQEIPVLPPEIMFLPNWFPINIYEFACWARTGVVPLTIVLTKRPICPIPDEARIQELFTHSNSSSPLSFDFSSIFTMKNFFVLTDKCLRFYEKSPFKPGRKRAVKKVLDWIIERTQIDGTWGGTQVGWSYPLIALKTVGYSADDPLIKNCLSGVIKNYSYEINGALQIEATNSVIWDTCLMLTALLDSGMPVNGQLIDNAVIFLLQNQITTAGDWQVKNPHTPPGGWAFQFANSYYPDVDDVAEVLIALSRYLKQSANDPTAKNKHEMINNAIQKGLTWLLSMQCTNGGWAAFDKDNTRMVLTELPFFDFGEILDPPSVDVTAHVIEALGELGVSKQNPQVERGLQFIFSEQEENGSWFGRWGVNYIYGTSAVIVALYSLHYDMSAPQLKRAYDWILSKQNKDGGWGESCASYASFKEHGKGASTASQTAWALMGLFLGGLWDHPAVSKGVDYLCHTLTADGIWDEPYFTGCGFGGYLTGTRATHSLVKDLGEELPTGFMLRYDLYRHYWPLRALGMYQQYLTKGPNKRFTFG